MSVTSNGMQANQHSASAAIGDGYTFPDDSGNFTGSDGLAVGFSSTATNLVAGDTNGVGDVFVRDVHPVPATIRASLNGSGVQGSLSILSPLSLSSKGRFVAFSSQATNMVVGDTNNTFDVFVRDRVAGTTQRVSISTGGVQANNASHTPSISSNGRYVAFYSLASNLVPGDTNGTYDIFVRDRSAGTTSRVSVNAGGVEGNGASANPSISPGGRYVAFTSLASNLVPADTNGGSDVFVRDLVAGSTRRVSVQTGGGQAGPSSGFAGRPVSVCVSGRYVAFQSNATNLVPGDTNGQPDIFIHDTSSAVTSRVSVSSANVQANSSSLNPALSANCRAVAFSSMASNLVTGDTNNVTDVFLRGVTGGTKRVSVGPGGVQGNAYSSSPAISSSGCYVAFESPATNLVVGDTNGHQDVFVHQVC